MTITTQVLFDYQREAAQRIFEQRRVLLADQPGLGKTLEVIGALELDGLFEKPSNILILTPIINAQTTWRDTFERFVLPKYDVQLVDVSKGTTVQKSKQFANVVPSKPTVVLANHNAIDWVKDRLRVPEISSLPYDAIIVDESHLVLPIRDEKKLTNFWKGMNKIRRTEDSIRVAVSGTPDRGRLENRYGTWLFLDPRHTPDRWSWLAKNFWLVEQKVARNRTVKMVQGLRDRESWMVLDRQKMIRRTKHEVLPQLPAKRYVDVELELGKFQMSAYLGQQIRSSLRMQDARKAGSDSPEAMLFALRARQIAVCQWSEDESPVPVVGGESAKLQWLLEWLDERGFIEADEMADNKAKVVIVSQFSKVLHWLQKELENVGLAAVVLDGSVSSGERARIQGDFQNGLLRVVLLSGSMGVGINLDAADDLIMVDSPYDPDKIEQIEDRVHRASSNHKVTIWNLIALDTIDQAIVEKVSKRYQSTRQLLDGSRGVDFARDIISLIYKESSNGLVVS